MLVAWCRLREAHPEFRLDRTQELKSSGEGFVLRFFRLERYFLEK